MPELDTDLVERVEREGLKLHRQPARRLTQAQFTDFQNLRRRHYFNELKERNDYEKGHYVNTLNPKSIRNLNREVGQGRKRHQRYARQEFILVTDKDDELRAALRFEDNASSTLLNERVASVQRITRLDRVKGAAEILGKLYVDRTVRGRELITARHAVIEEYVGSGWAGNIPDMEYALTAAAFRDKPERQGVAAYAFTEEEAYIDYLNALGLKPAGALVEDQSFGPNSNPAFVQPYRAQNLGQVVARAAEVTGVDEALRLMS